MEGDGGSVHATEEGSDGKVVVVGLPRLHRELFCADRVLKVSPDRVCLGLVGGVLDLEGVVGCLPGLAAEHDVVLGEGLLTDSLELVFVLLLGRLILEREETRSLADPLRAEGQREVLRSSFLDEHLAPVESEATSLAGLEGRDDFPLLAGVVDDRDLLRDPATGRDAELELSLDLLRNGSELVLVEPDVCPVEGLENHVAGV